MAKIDASQLKLEDIVIKVKRVSAVIRGGRRFSIQALVVVGDRNGHVGYGFGKGKEYADAIRKATEAAKRSLIEVPIVGSTIPYMVETSFGASRVLLKPAAPGTGVIAGMTLRSILELAGVHDVLTKSLGSTNQGNAVHACFKALQELKHAEEIARNRTKSIKDLVGTRRANYYSVKPEITEMTEKTTLSNIKSSKGKTTSSRRKTSVGTSKEGITV